MDSEVFEKLTVLGEGAKYDVSCSSSGADRSNIGRIGNAACAGICHSWAADGRCISLLKVLYSNDCVFDCQYCVNRRSADTARRTFEPKELADLTIEFYRRNYIEGLFLSSAVIISPDHTAERMYECLYILREVYGFAGYIHAKVIPGVSPELLHLIGLVSDRLSVNIELPSENSLAKLAPQKKTKGIFGPMRQITQTQAEQKTLKSAGLMGRLKKPVGLSFATEGIASAANGANTEFGDGSLSEIKAGSGELYRPQENPLTLIDRRINYKEKFAPAGQTTQMIVGASPESDLHIIKTSEALYHKFSMKRVYFSAYIPVADSPDLPPLGSASPQLREHRLYQADWLLRFYGFGAGEILTEDNPNLDYELDPKVVWALRNIEFFPVEVNKASFEELLRIPGIGGICAKRIMRQRRIAAVKYDDLKKMGVVLKRARFFLTCSGKYYGDNVFDPYYIRDKITDKQAIISTKQQTPAPLLSSADIRLKMNGGEERQISMFDALQTVVKKRQPLTANILEATPKPPLSSGALR
jgi:putative DNA modification/repair radical SAM protein